LACTLGLFLALAPAAQSVAQPDRARKFETRHYRVWTDVDIELGRDLCARMDAMYDEYARRFASLGASVQQTEKFDVRIFALRDDFVRYTRDRLPNTGGVFMPDRKLLAVFVEGQGRDGVRRTLQHEAFHQFAHRVVGPNMPVWLNEGIAQVFEEGIWTGSGFVLGQVPPRRIRQLNQDVTEGQLIDVRKMLAMSDAEWSAAFKDREAMATQYNQAWAMAHYLLYAPGADGQPLHRARVLDMLRRCKNGASPTDAFTQAFSDNLIGFQKRFNEYAQTLAPTREATYLDNQAVLADFLVALKQRGRSFETIESFRKALQRGRVRLQYTKGDLEWRSAEDIDEYFRDIDGRLMTTDELFFQPRDGAPLPDLVCRALEGVQLRTRFHAVEDKVEHELLVEPRP
jgi:hypothetical protein